MGGGKSAGPIKIQLLRPCNVLQCGTLGSSLAIGLQRCALYYYSIGGTADSLLYRSWLRLFKSAETLCKQNTNIWFADIFTAR